MLNIKIISEAEEGGREKNTKKLKPTKPKTNKNRRKQKQLVPISSEDNDGWISSGNSIMDLSDEDSNDN